MKEEKSLFPVRLLIVYVFLFSLIPTLDVVSNFGNIEASIEGWNPDMEYSLIVCLPLMAVAILSIRYFRRMPVLAALTASFAVWHIRSTLIWYFGLGFDPRQIGNDFQPVGFLEFSAVFAVPFILAYLAWLWWRMRKIARDPSTSSG